MAWHGIISISVCGITHDSLLLDRFSDGRKPIGLYLYLLQQKKNPRAKSKNKFFVVGCTVLNFV